MTPVALTIAGSDPSGGAGLQADLKTFHQHGVYGMSVVTLLTVQNTQTVSEVKTLEPDFVTAQLAAVISDIAPGAAKTGALGNVAIIEKVAERAAMFPFPLVIDPVMISKHGAPLIHKDAVQVFKNKLLPHALLVTPNLPEAAKLADRKVTNVASMEAAAAAISQLGVANVLVKGGHLPGDAADLLLSNGQMHWFPAERIDTQHTHGTGCVISAAITARVAKGDDLITAVEGAKRFVNAAITSNPQLGHGYGPLNLHAKVCDTKTANRDH